MAATTLPTRWLATAAALLMAATALGWLAMSSGSDHTAAAQDGAGEVRDLDAACGALDLDLVAFLDLDRNPAATQDAIRCLAAYEITQGHADGSYRGGDDVQRYQMALFLDRVLDYADDHGDVDLPDTPSQPGFDDTGDLSGEAQAAIARLEALEVTTGTTADTFSPHASVTRRDMASFIVRLQGVIDEPYSTLEEVLFPDVDADLPRAGDINAIAVEGIAGGYADGTYRPFASVSRAHMALFVMRHIDENVAAGRIEARTEVPPGAGGLAGVRAAWVHLFDDTLKSEESIEELVADLDAAGANVIVAQVARRHDAYYDSNVLPRSADPDLEPGFDVIDELTAEADAAGLEVHAWISVAPTYHGVYDDLPEPDGWLAAEHGTTAPEADQWVTRTVDGEVSDYLDPALPEVREHVTDVVGELAADYDLDGIHLDYVRYQSERHGYHPDAVARFQDETGATSTPAPRDQAWSDWRREQTAAVMEEAGQAIDATGADVELSAATITWSPAPVDTDAGFTGTRAYRDTLQDWQGWARNGLVDVVYPMSYFREHNAAQAEDFRGWLAFQRNLAAEGDVDVVVGVAGFLNARDAGVDQVGRAMRATGGAAVYSYQQPVLDPGQEDPATFWSELARTSWLGR